MVTVVVVVVVMASAAVVVVVVVLFPLFSCPFQLFVCLLIA